jgi:hypothetical protein
VSPEFGERVGALLGVKNKVVDFLGYGVYEGDFDPDDPTYEPNAVGLVHDMATMRGHFLNPRIKLDSGKTVWGCECWWGSEEQMKEEIERYKIAGFSIKDVDIDEIRKEIKK